MPATPGGSQRRAQPRHWSALATPIGFERCVRETLRELYGYVALLEGRDRRAAERLVAEVYRSLFRAAGAGVVDDVTLGGLRSAARRAWLDEHRTELATTDEVSRAPASTIADLSTLERAVLVLRHVNAMSVERTAAELGRTDREVAAVGAHAVRRLRGTDDTSGAWLRAYLGPSVTPTAGLVDRIVDRLGDEPVDAAPPEPEPRADDIESAAPAVLADAVPEAAATAGDVPADVGAIETTELAVVDHPTVELPAVTGPRDEPEPTAPIVTPVGADEPPVEPVRPRWALVVGVVLLVALVAALIWLALRGDGDDTVVSTPAASVEGATATTAAATVATTVAPTTSRPSPTAAAGPVELGFDPPCADSAGAEPTTVTWATTFGPLAAAPAVTITLPDSVDVAAEAERLPPRTLTVLRPDGVVVAIRPAAEHRATSTVLARVGLDGTVAWVRCVDGIVDIAAAPDAGVDLAVRPAGDDAAWTAVALADGAPGEALDDERRAAVEAARDEPSATAASDDGPRLGFSYDSELGRSVLAGLDDGRAVWTMPDVVLPSDGFRAVAVGGTVVAQHCPDACAAGELRGYDLLTGELLWSRPGAHDVAATGDGLVLVGDGAVWELVDAATGIALDGQRWDDADTFDVGDDPDAGEVRREGGALVVVRPGTIAVWLPADAGGDAAEVELP